MGDTGTGKSSLIRQMLERVVDRDEAVVVYDPALEFTPQFFRPDRGDQILNPLDTRMPYWPPGDEIQHRAEALAFAKALFPDDRRERSCSASWISFAGVPRPEADSVAFASRMVSSNAAGPRTWITPPTFGNADQFPGSSRTRSVEQTIDRMLWGSRPASYAMSTTSPLRL
jgi:hypothetical protein